MDAWRLTRWVGVAIWLVEPVVGVLGLIDAPDVVGGETHQLGVPKWKTLGEHRWTEKSQETLSHCFGFWINEKDYIVNSNYNDSYTWLVLGLLFDALWWARLVREEGDPVFEISLWMTNLVVSASVDGRLAGEMNAPEPWENLTESALHPRRAKIHSSSFTCGMYLPRRAWCWRGRTSLRCRPLAHIEDAIVSETNTDTSCEGLRGYAYW